MAKAGGPVNAPLATIATIIAAAAVLHRAFSFPSEGVAAPGWITGIGWSDHWAFWKEGYPAVMVTDTALFRYQYYHTPGDTPDKMDFERTARVVAGMARVLEDLAENGMAGF